MSSGHQFRPLNTWYVAKNGTNSGTGGPLEPLLTVAEALTRAQAVAGTTPQVIYVNPGTYAEGTLTITKGYVTMIGMAPSQSVNATTTIVANINVNITSPANNLYGNQVVFANLTLAQLPGVATSIPLLSDSSTKQHSLIFKSAQLYGRNGLLSLNPAVALDSRVYIEDCELVQSAEAVPAGEISPLVLHSVGALSMVRATFSAIKNATCLRITNSGVAWTIGLCNFQATTSDAIAQPLVRLESEVSFPTAFNLCGFSYTNATPKDPSVSTAIVFGGAVGQQIVLANCLFALLGLGYDAYGVRVEGVATHQVYLSNSAAYPTTAYSINAPIGKLISLAPRLA